MMFWQQHGAHGTEETTAAHRNQESSIASAWRAHK